MVTVVLILILLFLLFLNHGSILVLITTTDDCRTKTHDDAVGAFVISISSLLRLRGSSCSSPESVLHATSICGNGATIVFVIVVVVMAEYCSNVSPRRRHTSSTG